MVKISDRRNSPNEKSMILRAFVKQMRAYAEIPDAVVPVSVRVYVHVCEQLVYINHLRVSVFLLQPIKVAIMKLSLV